MIDQFHRPATAGVSCAPPRIVRGYAAFQVGSPAGVEGSIAA